MSLPDQNPIDSPQSPLDIALQQPPQPSLFKSSQKKYNPNHLIGGLVVSMLVLGMGVSMALVGRSGDNRNRAMESAPTVYPTATPLPPVCYTTTCMNNQQTNCFYGSPLAPVACSAAGCDNSTGRCYAATCTTSRCTTDQWRSVTLRCEGNVYTTAETCTLGCNTTGTACATATPTPSYTLTPTPFSVPPSCTTSRCTNHPEWYPAGYYQELCTSSHTYTSPSYCGANVGCNSPSTLCFVPSPTPTRTLTPTRTPTPSVTPATAFCYYQTTPYPEGRCGQLPGTTYYYSCEKVSPPDPKVDWKNKPYGCSATPTPLRVY